MIYGTYLSAAGLSNEQARQDVIANNLANVETGGFKRHLTMFQERRPHPDTPAGPGDPLGLITGGRDMLPTRLDLTQGGLEETGNPLDLALVGEGFLRVRRGGEEFLTRDGRLTLDDAGNLTLAADESSQVLDADGLPVNIDAAPGTFFVDESGAVVDRETGEPLARLALSTADGLKSAGGGRFRFDGQARPDDATTVQPGRLERSNVEPTVELTRLIESARLLEANAQMIRHQDQSLGKLLEAGSVG